ncbi:MAG TPA: PLP-dependent aminotransferase family protein [Actinomycetes bacterium]|nr:PLP-dependent aminotransferase family protein [Actinomycetes bacterium]
MAPRSAPHIERRLRGWAAGEGPLHARLASALAAAIERGDILPGTRLPPERSLAKALSVGRSTVVAAYASLARQGLVARRQGSGTWVQPVGEYARGRAGELASRAQHRLFAVSSFDDRRDAISFLAATPGAVEALRDLSAQAAAEIDRISGHHGYWPLGYPPLRQEIAKRFTARGLRTTEAEVLVTTGGQQAIALTAAAFVGPGAFVVLEDPTYPGAIDAYRQTGARILSAPVGPTGIDLDLLRELLERAAVKLVYATPSFQNPTGAVMPRGERHRLAQLASTHGAVLVEDEAHAELALHAAAPLPVAAFADGASVVTIGSLSKVFWGGLRVGWIRAPQPVLSHLGRLKAILDLGSALPSQVLAALLLQRADEIIPDRTDELRSRATLLGSLVSTLLAGWSFAAPAGGLVLWAKLPHGSASELAEVARANGVLILPGSMTSPSGWFDDHVRLPYVARPEVLEQGVQRLARAWESYGGRDAGLDREVGVIG